jgi:TolB-like protein
MHVHGLGYRLERTDTMPSTGAEAAPAPATVPATGRRRPSRPSIAALISVACAVAGSMWFFQNSPPQGPAPRQAQVSVLPFNHPESLPGMGALANDLLHKISTDLTDARILIAGARGTEVSSSYPSEVTPHIDAEFLVGGRIRSEGDALEVAVQLTDAAEQLVVWSGTFQESTGGRAALLARVATEVAHAAHSAVIGRTGKVRLDATSVAALVAARNSVSVVGRSTTALETENYKKIIAAAPDFAWGYSGLAVGYAFQLRNSPPNESLRNEARQLAHRALELDPKNGEAYVALELLSDRFHWQQREELLLKGIDADPDFEPASMMEGRLLWSVGRNHDALPWFKRAYNTDPLHNDNVFTYAASLASEGYAHDSQKLVAQMEARWPDQIATRNARFWTSVISGTTDVTLAILATPAKWPLGMNQNSSQVWQMALTAYASKDGAARSRAIEAVKNTAANGSLNRGEALLLLSLFNDVDGAFAQAQFYEPADPRWGPFLFLAPTKVMRFDPRFMLLAVGFGYAAYWRSTDNWPDFCSAPDLPYNCTAEVAKLAENDPSLEPIAARPIAATY